MFIGYATIAYAFFKFGFYEAIMSFLIFIASIIPHLILPSIVSLIIPLILSLGKVNGNALDDPNANDFEEGEKLYPQVTRVEKAIISLVGIFGLVSVPVFKSATGLPPFMGVLLVMGLLWFITEIIYKKLMSCHMSVNLWVFPVFLSLEP